MSGDAAPPPTPVPAPVPAPVPTPGPAAAPNAAPPAPPPRARARFGGRLLRSFGAYLAGLVLSLGLLGGALWWLLITESGTQWLLARVPGVQISGVSGALLGAFQAQQVDVPLRDQIIGRVCVNNIINPVTDEVIVRENEMVTAEMAAKIEELGIDEVFVRSPLTSESRTGWSVITSSSTSWPSPPAAGPYPAHSGGAAAGKSANARPARHWEEWWRRGKGRRQCSAWQARRSKKAEGCGWNTSGSTRPAGRAQSAGQGWQYGRNRG